MPAFLILEDAKNEIINNQLIFIKNVGIYYSGKNPGVIDQLECFKKSLVFSKEIMKLIL